MSTETEFIAFRKIPRLNREIAITEKIDGTNAQILIGPIPTTAHTPPIATIENGGEYTGIWAGSRNRWLSVVSDNFGFARWVSENFMELSLLGPGRHFGEWWGQGIQRNYGLKEKRFSMFKHPGADIKLPACVGLVPVLDRRDTLRTSYVEFAVNMLREHGSFAAPGFMKPEGIVIYHSAANQLFKVTLDNDEKPKTFITEAACKPFEKADPLIDDAAKPYSPDDLAWVTGSGRFAQ